MGISLHFLEQREVDFPLLLESHPHAITHIDGFHCATDNISGEIDSRSAVDGDPRNDEGNLQSRTPLLIIDGKRIHDTGSGNRLGCNILRQALSAHGPRRMYERCTIAATQEL
jgi:hypothetical protein